VLKIGSIISPDVLSIHNDANVWGPEDPNLSRNEICFDSNENVFMLFTSTF